MFYCGKNRFYSFQNVLWNVCSGKIGQYGHWTWSFSLCVCVREKLCHKHRHFFSLWAQTIVLLCVFFALARPLSLWSLFYMFTPQPHNRNCHLTIYDNIFPSTAYFLLCHTPFGLGTKAKVVSASFGAMNKKNAIFISNASHISSNYVRA